MATSPLNAMKDAPVLSATGADEDYAAKYANALEKISQTLDARTNLTPNYFNIAAELFVAKTLPYRILIIQMFFQESPWFCLNDGIQC